MRNLPFSARTLQIVLALVLGFALGSTLLSQPGGGPPTGVPASQLRLDFDPAYFTLTTDGTTGRTTVRLIRPIPEDPGAPLEALTATLNCSGLVCEFDPVPTAAGLLSQDVYRNGIYQTAGRDYTRGTGGSGQPIITFTNGGDVQTWEVVQSRLYVRSAQ